MSSVGQAEVAELPAPPAGGPGGTVTNEPGAPARRTREDVPATVEVAEGLRTEVLFHEARRLRRRRWAIGAAVMAVALLAAGTALSSAGHLSSAAPGPRHASRDNTAALASGAHASLYFRPVECTIATPSARGSGTPAGTALPLGPLGGALCSANSAQQARYPSTPPGRDKPGSIVVLPLYVRLPPYLPGAGRYVLGPAEMSGSVIAGATAAFASPIDQWVVDITFTKAGSAQFNAFAAKHYRCYAQDPTNPPFCALQAVELDGTVLAAPALEASAFPGGATIAGSMAYPYTKAQAVKLASLVRASSSMAPIHN